MATASPIPVDDQGRIDADLPCLECGYNLRTQPLETGRCPECALPVGRSAIGNRLRFCDPAWVRRIGWGLNLSLASLLAALAFALAMRWMGMAATYDNYLILPTVLLVAMLMLGLWGVLRATAPDPMTRKDEPAWSVRRTSRFLLPLFIAMSSFWIVNWAVFDRGGWGETSYYYTASNGIGWHTQRGHWGDFVSRLVGVGFDAVQALAWWLGLALPPLLVWSLARRAGAGLLKRISMAVTIGACLIVPAHALLVENLFGVTLWLQRHFFPPVVFSGYIPYQPITPWGNAFLAAHDWLPAGVIAISAGVAVVVLWLWPVIWRQARLARESWGVA